MVWFQRVVILFQRKLDGCTPITVARFFMFCFDVALNKMDALQRICLSCQHLAILQTSVQITHWKWITRKCLPKKNLLQEFSSSCVPIN